jgi:hypothetical protein
MNSVKVKRDELLKKLKANRQTHTDTFERAVKVFRERMIEELDRMLKDARGGNAVSGFVSLPRPENHTDDYDRVIAMLEMSVDEVIELPNREFGMYVMDKWGWAESFLSNTTSYVR